MNATLTDSENPQQCAGFRCICFDHQEFMSLPQRSMQRIALTAVFERRSSI
jgi:hypothetical protein